MMPLLWQVLFVYWTEKVLERGREQDAIETGSWFGEWNVSPSFGDLWNVRVWGKLKATIGSFLAPLLLRKMKMLCLSSKVNYLSVRVKWKGSLSLLVITARVDVVTIVWIVVVAECGIFLARTTRKLVRWAPFSHVQCCSKRP